MKHNEIQGVLYGSIQGTKGTKGIHRQQWELHASAMCKENRNGKFWERRKFMFRQLFLHYLIPTFHSALARGFSHQVNYNSVIIHFPTPTHVLLLYYTLGNYNMFLPLPLPTTQHNTAHNTTIN